MKIRYLLILGIIAFPGYSFGKINTPNEEVKHTIELLWEEEKQTIDGFGVSQAGWAHSLYMNFQREEVMEKLFGQNGLHLNILRGEIFPHYRENESDNSFKLSANLDLPLTDSFFQEATDDLKERGQLWVTKQAKEKYQVEKLLFSAWSPPAYMKSNGKVSDGFLKPEFYHAYAEYLAEFYKAYKTVGLDSYAISPSNEPGYPAPWNSCVWSAEQMGEFICKHLGPVFQEQDIPAKIVFGENPLWAVETKLASFVSSLDFVNTIIDRYPEIVNYHPIAAGHGYTIPVEMFPEVEGLNSPVVPFEAAEKLKIPVWMTEVSTIDPLDVSMENGLYWAEIFHEFLSVANVNAFIWWGGAIPAGNNESLVVLDENREGYLLTKRYETFGNYTRYIPSGSKRVAVNNPDDRLLVSAYKNGKEYTVVAVNNTEARIQAKLEIPGEYTTADLNGFLTDEANCWTHKTFGTKEGDGYVVDIPAQSVITFTGRIE